MVVVIINETATSGNPQRTIMPNPDFDFLVEPEYTEQAETIHVGPNIKDAVKMTPRKFATAVLEVFNSLGGASWLMTQAKADPRAFIELLKKLLPKSIQLDDLPGLQINLIDQFGNEVQISTGAPLDTATKTSPDTATSEGPAKSGQLSLPHEIATGGSSTPSGLISSSSQKEPLIDIKEVFE